MADAIYGHIEADEFARATRLSWVQSNATGYEAMLFPALRDSEVVVTGLSRKEKRSAAASTAPSTTPPAPRGGFDKFEDYLRKNREYPAQALENGITGTVLLEFTVDEKGRPGNVRVLQSLGYGYDEEAIRLIEEGPRWKDAGPGERIRYAVRFD